MLDKHRRRKFEGERSVWWGLWGFSAFVVFALWVNGHWKLACFAILLSPFFVTICVLAWERLMIWDKEENQNKYRDE